MDAPIKLIRKKTLYEMKYEEMVSEVLNVRKCLKDRFLNISERSDLRKYVRRLEKEIYDYEKFRGITQSAI